MTLTPFKDPQEHLTAALQRLDLLLHREILRLRAAYQLSLDEFRGLYVTDEQVDSLIQESAGLPDEDPLTEQITQRAEQLQQLLQARLSPELPWVRVASRFELTPFEQDLMLLALAPEVDPRYETLYAYLNNDVTRRWPTCDLALRVLVPARPDRLAARCHLMPQAPLFRRQVLRPIVPSPERPYWLTGGFSLTPAVCHSLLGHHWQDPEMAPYAELRDPEPGWESVPLPAEERERLQGMASAVASAARSRGPAPVLVLEGRPGSGRGAAAAAIGRDLGRPLLRVDLEALMAAPETPSAAARKLDLYQRLQDAVVYLEPGEALMDHEGRPAAEGRRALSLLAHVGGPLLLGCAAGTPWRALLAGAPALAFTFPDPDYSRRCELWRVALNEAGGHAPVSEVRDLASRFSLTPGQIQSSVSEALLRRELRGAAANGLEPTDLAEAARGQSEQSLGSLAAKVALVWEWDDLVLPPATLRRVREVAAAIRFRHLVFHEWGFQRRAATGRGLKVLFEGSSGTGKTMAAAVVARDLGLDLYRVDLSGVVSKYIGETEKNLEAIFRAAQCSNAILLFDEADALFGKRSEVKDAHDRYANLEIAYLLQRMESYDGAVILASNLSKNIDEAFSRRMHTIIEFPMPDEVHRERLWRLMLPPQVPLGEDVDFGFLARQFPIAGGDIRNVALDAAFLAAQDGQVVTMKQLIQAMARQVVKQGRIPSTADFKQYHALIAQVE